MARGRVIDKRLGKSKKFAALPSDKARILYVLMYLWTDQEGKMNADIEEIRTDCVLYLRYSYQVIIEMVMELIHEKLLILYKIKGKFYFKFTKFEEFHPHIRKNREAPSRIPDPPVNKYVLNMGLLRSWSGVLPPSKLNLNRIKDKLNRLNRRGVRGKVVSLRGLYFDIVAQKFKNIKKEDLLRWKKTYPSLDINQEILKMEDWILANWLSGKGQKKDWPRFIRNWLSREQKDIAQGKISDRSFLYVGKSRDKDKIDPAYLNARMQKVKELEKKHGIPKLDEKKQEDRKKIFEIQDKIREEIAEWSNEYWDEREKK